MADQGDNGAQPVNRVLTAGDQQGQEDPIRLNVELTGSAEAVPGTLRSTGPQAAEGTAPGGTAAEQQALAVAVVQGLETPRQQRVAAEGVIEALPSEAKQNLAAAVVQSLGTPHQQRVAAEGVIEALPSEAKQNLAATVVQSLDTPHQQRVAAERVVELLPADQRERLAEGVLGQPDRMTRQRLWYVIIGSLATAIFVFGMMAFILIYQKKPAEAPLALATTALGGIVGLIATSPGSRRSN